MTCYSYEKTRYDIIIEAKNREDALEAAQNTSLSDWPDQYEPNNYNQYVVAKLHLPKPDTWWVFKDKRLVEFIHVIGVDKDISAEVYGQSKTWALDAITITDWEDDFQDKNLQPITETDKIAKVMLQVQDYKKV